MVIQSLMWVALPLVVYGVLAAWLPGPGPPARWRVRWRRRAAEREKRKAPPPAPPPDPFAVLRLQLRLGALAAQLRALDADPHPWARGRRQLAVQAAYDALLAEACRLADVEIAESAEGGSSLREAGLPVDEAERFREELALTERGWSW
ncbi:hypothetical protein [Actinotalea soli]|uniref:hypothetical protein n=1 Tax=Actinotalea soli TaxID=2819234 RepID=UPI001FB6AEAA|nr:hypothetical protein [Actinotalea soli]